MARPHRKGSRLAAAGEAVSSGEQAAEGVPSPASDPETGCNRRCIVSGEVRPKDELIRFVVGPDLTVVPDLEGKLPGRGLWLSGRHDVVQTAVSRKAFARAARKAVVVPADLADAVGVRLRQRCLDMLGLSRRAGLVVAGYDKVRAAALGGQVVMLLQAEDSSAEGRRKITALLPGVPVIENFSGAELASVLGRDHIVHVAVLTGSLGQRGIAVALGNALRRLAAYAGQVAQHDDVPAAGPGRTEPMELQVTGVAARAPSGQTDSDA